MTATLEEFLEIEARLGRIGNYWSRVQLICELGRERVHAWDDLIVAHQGSVHSLMCVLYADGLILHNTLGPCTPGHSYYLFGHYLRREEWFACMDMTGEDQLAHVLKWGHT